MDGIRKKMDDMRAKAASEGERADIAEAKLKEVEAELNKLREAHASLEAKSENQAAKIDDLQSDLNTVTNQVRRMDVELEVAQKALAGAQAALEQEEQAHLATKQKLKEINAELASLESEMHGL